MILVVLGIVVVVTWVNLTIWAFRDSIDVDEGKVLHPGRNFAALLACVTIGLVLYINLPTRDATAVYATAWAAGVTAMVAAMATLALRY